MTMEISLTDKEIKVLKELLSLDMDSIGFDDNEIEILNEIFLKLKSSNIKKSSKTPAPFRVKKFKDN